MPLCKICGKRIPISTTGVWVYKCRWCGRVVCRDDYEMVRSLCIECARLKVSRPPYSKVA